MRDNIILYITGLHSTGADNDSVEMIHAGRYFSKNGRHYIKYQESLDDGVVTDNMIKISPGEVETVRKGPVTTRGVRQKGFQKNSQKNYGQQE